MLIPIYRNKFNKDIENSKKRNKDIDKLKIVIAFLIQNTPLPKKYKNHKLQGIYKGYWECHIEPDWLLIYQKTETELILARLGTHSDLFK